MLQLVAARVTGLGLVTSESRVGINNVMFKHIMSHHENKYPYAIVVDQLISILGFQQNTLTDDQYHEKSGTKFDVATSQDVTFESKILL